MKTVGILTTFANLHPSYSLASVVEAQLHALKNHGYKTILFTHDNFKDDDRIPEGVEIRKVIPRGLLVDYGANQKPHEDLESQAKEIYNVLIENARDCDVLINHDWILVGWFLPYCIALHNFAKEVRHIKHLNWVHSVPSPMPAGLDFPHKFRYMLPDNSKLVYLNNFGLVQAAEAYNTFPKDVRIVYNPVDPRLFFDLHPLVHKLIKEYGILDADFLQVYPVSTPRMVSGKGLHTLIDIFSKLKLEGKKVCLVICNAHANDKREKQLIAETISYASQKGLNQSELVFSSMMDVPTYELGVSRKVVSDLFRLANLFVFPSTSENCSLILLEAMLSNNMLILNSNVPSMREFGKDMALYFEFGGKDSNVEYQNKDKYMHEVALHIISEMKQNKALRASNEIKKYFNYSHVFKTQIEPLLFEN